MRRVHVDLTSLCIPRSAPCVTDPSETKNKCVKTSRPGPNGEGFAWFQCTVMGGREGRDIGAYELAVAMEDLGAGEILLNCIDEDGQGNGGGMCWCRADRP